MINIDKNKLYSLNEMEEIFKSIDLPFTKITIKKYHQLGKIKMKRLDVWGKWVCKGSDLLDYIKKNT